MEEILLKLKLSFFLIFTLFLSSLNAYDVLVLKEDIRYKEKISVNNLRAKQVKNIRKNCVPVTLKYLDKGTFIASRFIRMGSILCRNSVKKFKKSSVLFDFGAIEIERNAKVLYENDEYITIRNQDGTTQKIFKDGREK